MGYTSYFTGNVRVTPPLNSVEITYLTAFSETRRMDRERGPYFVDPPISTSGPKTNSLSLALDYNKISDTMQKKEWVNYNQPPEGQPGLWCQWVPALDGKSIAWNEAEKFYNSAEWMQYLIDHFIGDQPIARQQYPDAVFLEGHTVSGKIEVSGEDEDDHWFLEVIDNQVYVLDANGRTALPRSVKNTQAATQGVLAAT
ncbi:MAG: hypothetical protein ACYC3W_10905 [Candidatus Nanopelagicales bacterium]